MIKVLPLTILIYNYADIICTPNNIFIYPTGRLKKVRQSATLEYIRQHLGSSRNTVITAAILDVVSEGMNARLGSFVRELMRDQITE
jgi:hypothetical protein